MDHNVNDAARHIQQDEDAALSACGDAALAAGVPYERAEQCEDGECCCPTCPWKQMSKNWREHE